MKYDFDRKVVREGSRCEKYDSRKEIFGRADVIPLWVADMDFEVAPFITEAILRRASHPVYGYEFRGKSFYESAVGWMARRHGWTTQPEWMSFTPGVVSGLVCAMRAVTAEGDGVVIQPPVYPPFARVTRSNGRQLVENPLRETPNGYEMDFEDLDRKLAGAKALLFCNPQNPTGRVFTREELERVGELCVKHDVILISDEIHCDLIQSPHRHVHIASLSEEVARRTITLVAPSKTFNTAGLSTSLAVIPDDSLRCRFRAEFDKIHIDQGNAFGAAALEAAYTYGDEWLDQLLDYVRGNMEYVVEFLGRNLPSVKTRLSEGTYMMWLDFRSWGLTADDLWHFLVFDAGLGLNDGARFGTGGECFMRINLATRHAVVEQALSQLLAACEKRGIGLE